MKPINMNNKNLTDFVIYPIAFVPKPFSPEDNHMLMTMADYEIRSTYSGYYYRSGIYRLLGWEYRFGQFLHTYWVRNHGPIFEMKALNITDCKRVLRAHHETISRDFKAVKIE